MFLGLSAYGFSYFSDYKYYIIKGYNKITFLGNLHYDNIRLCNTEIEDTVLLTTTTEDIYDENTLFVANFENNLEGGLYAGEEKTITKWRIKRRKFGEYAFKVIGETTKDFSPYYDYTQANNQLYEYYACPVADDGIEGIAVSGMAQSNFHGWFLISRDNTIAYKFDVELNSEPIILNVDRKMYENYTPYPVFRQGQRKYHTGGLTTIPYTYNNKRIVFNYSTIKSIENFINNGETKVLRNTKGDVFYVQTQDFQYTIDEKVLEQPVTISFKFVEVAGE
jgi:hypothetical protein